LTLAATTVTYMALQVSSKFLSTSR